MFLQKIQDSSPCTYMHVHVSTSYFKMFKHVFLYTKQFSLVGCGQISLLLMLKTHSAIQRVAIHSSMKLTCLFCLLSHLELSQIHVCLLAFIILHAHRINLYKLTVVVFHSYYFLDKPCSITVQNNIYIVCAQ